MSEKLKGERLKKIGRLKIKFLNLYVEDPQDGSDFDNMMFDKFNEMNEWVKKH